MATWIKLKRLEQARFCLDLQYPEVYKDLLNNGHAMSLNDNDSDYGVEGFMYDLPNVFYIVFFPTNHPKDWWINFNVQKAQIPYESTDSDSDIRVAKGWVDAYDTPSIRKKILDYVQSNVDTKKHIVVTGYSLGAAIATLNVLDLKYNLPHRKYSLYTFGSPKVGNQVFVDSFNKRVSIAFNFNNGDDIVHKLPYTALAPVLWTVYSHVGVKQHIGHPHRWYNLFGRVKDHYRESYKQSLIQEKKKWQRIKTS